MSVEWTITGTEIMVFFITYSCLSGLWATLVKVLTDCDKGDAAWAGFVWPVTLPFVVTRELVMKGLTMWNPKFHRFKW